MPTSPVAAPVCIGACGKSIEPGQPKRYIYPVPNAPLFFGGFVCLKDLPEMERQQVESGLLNITYVHPWKSRQIHA
jgi:hypothetical protein